MKTLFHFSEDPAIEVFVPRIVPASTEAEAFVWAVDEEHAPSYWFPRDCPRACCWVNKTQLPSVTPRLPGLGDAQRMHAMELSWLDRLLACKLFAYRLDSEAFELRVQEAGYWVAREEVRPHSVTAVGDLVRRHAEADIEVRLVSNLWPVIDDIVASGLEFSIIRKANAQPRLAAARVEVG